MSGTVETRWFVASIALLILCSLVLITSGLVAELKARRARGGWQHGGIVVLDRSIARYAYTALAGSGDNGDRYCARQIKEAMDRQKAFAIGPDNTE